MLSTPAPELTKARGRAMLEAAGANFRALGMVLHVALAERALLD